VLRTRAISALVLVVPVVALLYLGDLPWLAGVVLVALLGVFELVAALRSNNCRPLTAVGVFLAVGLPCAAYADATLSLMLPVIVGVLLASLVWSLLRPNLEGALADWALSLAGMLYVALLLSYFVALRQVDRGLQWILLAFLCTWACDSAAYLVGRAIGKHPFSPRISPKKTWEGTIGGVLAATLTGLLAMPLLDAPLALGLILGFAVALAAVAGDLAESFIKRQLSIKDSGTLIPGHGGVLDRVDSLLFALPLVYYVAIWWGRF
jgi:phosphatidate cytidylyltransferase